MTTKSDAGMGHPRALEVAATRRQVVRALPVAAAAFAIPGSFVPGESGNVQAQTRPSPLTGHFHPKGKAPSKFTLEVLKKRKSRFAVRRHTRLR